MTAALLPLAYFAAVLVLAWRRPVAIRSRWVQLLRFLLPSWRFFDELGELPILSFREGDSAASLGVWQPAIPAVPRSLRRLVLNADGNLRLAYESLVQQLMADIAALERPTPDGVAALVSYRLVGNLVRSRVTQASWQWKVDLLPPEGAAEEALVSTVLAR